MRMSEAGTDAIATVAHELRNSLSVVRNASQLLRMSARPGGHIDQARVLIERHVEQMSRHVDDLLDSSYRDTRKPSLRRERVDLRTVVAHAVEAIAPDIARRGHRLSVLQHEAPLWAVADAARLEQVFFNLLINAAKYTPDDGDLTLTIEQVDGCGVFRVRDSGIGIEAAMLPRVFDLFTQSDADGMRGEGGRGIGLAVVRDFVELHGGNVRAESAGLGSGSQFTVMLPLLHGGQGT